MYYQEIIDKYYPADSRLRDIYMRHCRQVADMALEIARQNNLPISEEEIESAAMLHDIGIFSTNAPSIECRGDQPYIRHGLIGATLLRNEGAPESWARVAERHTGAGLTADEIHAQQLPLPETDLLPETLLEKLVCYADKFYSKSGSMEKKTRDKVLRGMARFGQDSFNRFLQLESALKVIPVDPG